MAKRLILPFLVALLLAAACGDDSSATSPAPDTDDTGTDDTGTDDTEAGADGPIDGCSAQGFLGQISRTADGDQVAADFTGGASADVWSDGVVATRLADGGHYTLYVGNHVYDGDPRSFETVTAAPGGTVATFSLGFESGFTAGEWIDLNGDDGVTMAVIIDSGGGASASSTGAIGQFKPIAWSDDWICIDLDYFDDFQSANGVISAPIVASF